MQDTVVIGKRLIPLAHVAFIEPIDAAALERIESERPYQARLVLLDRSSVLTEESLEGFAKAHGFRNVEADGVALNPAVTTFRVESFEPKGEFQPTKPYRSRLLWRDLQAQVQSRLMVAAPEDLLAAVRAANSASKRSGPGTRASGSKSPDPQPR